MDGGSHAIPPSGELEDVELASSLRVAVTLALLQSELKATVYAVALAADRSNSSGMLSPDTSTSRLEL